MASPYAKSPPGPKRTLSGTMSDRALEDGREAQQPIMPFMGNKDDSLNDGVAEVLAAQDNKIDCLTDAMAELKCMQEQTVLQPNGLVSDLKRVLTHIDSGQSELHVKTERNQLGPKNWNRNRKCMVR